MKRQQEARLTCEDDKPITDDTEMADCLVKNKRFFPTFAEKIDFSVQIAKAAVLLQKSWAVMQGHVSRENSS